MGFYATDTLQSQTDLSSVASSNAKENEYLRPKNRIRVFDADYDGFASDELAQLIEPHQEILTLDTTIASVSVYWLSNDPIGISGGLNQYVFAANNAINFTDPLGKDAYVAVSGNKITIEIPVIFIGIARNDIEYKQKVKRAIEDRWSGKFGKWEVKTTVVDPKKGGLVNSIDLDYSYGIGGTGALVKNSRSMLLYGNDGCDTYAHEAGHLLGMKDRYKDVLDRNGFKTSVPMSEKWKGNIMATGSEVQEINFADWVTSIKDGMIVGESGL